jgi:hypothetical protein
MNHYVNLGVLLKSTQDDIRKEYDYLANKIIPFMDESNQLANDFIDITSSFEALFDYRSRYQYNQTLSVNDIRNINFNYRKLLNSKYMFLVLEKNILNLIKITYFDNGQLISKEGYLISLAPFKSVTLSNNETIPFLSENIAIKSISLFKNNKPIYINYRVDENYHIEDEKELQDMYNKSWGLTMGKISYDLNMIDRVGEKLVQKK